MTSIRSGQEGFAEMYEQVLAQPLFRPWVELLLDDLSLGPRDRVIDIACGTGIVARLAKDRVGPTAAVVGVDRSAPMLAVARRVAPGIDWREGEAESLPLEPGEQFDAVACQQGLQFFSDRAAAVREMYRASAPGARVAVSTWRPDDEAPFGRELRTVAERHLGPVVDRRHSFGEPGPVEALFSKAGFRDVRSKTVRRTIRFPAVADFVRLNAMALVGMSERAAGLSDAERERMIADIARDGEAVARRYSDADGLAFELSTNVTTARR